MLKSNIKTIVILGIISIIGIFSLQGYFLRIAFIESKKDFSQKVSISLENVASEVVAYNNHELTVLNPVQQYGFNYYIVNVNDNINEVVLKHYLKTEFEKVDIQLDYRFAIYDCDIQKMVNANLVTDQGNNYEELPEIDFPILTDYVYYFGIEFPGLWVYLIRSLSIWLVFTVVSIIALIFFGYAIFTILQQNRLSKLQKDFINNMTHEFKTPISSIQLASEYLLTNEQISSEKRLKKYVELLVDQNARLNKHVESILQMAKTEKKSFQLETKAVDIVPILKETIELYMLKFSNQVKVNFNSNFEKLNITADEFHFTNLVHNIIDNSIKYCDNNCNINILLSNFDHQKQLIFHDNGIGISEKYHKKIFQKFYRIPTGNVHNVKGFGLGLYYVKTICDKHNWKIKLESELNQGTKIIITFKE